MDFEEQMDIYLRARFTLMMLVTPEEERALQTVKAVCERMQRPCLTWDDAEGFAALAEKGGTLPSARDPLTALEQVDKTEGDTLFVLKDFHECWDNAQVKRKLRSLAHRLMQWNTISEGYAFPGKAPSIGYPDWGFARVLRPGCVFTLYILVHDNASLPGAPALHDLLAGRVARVRLGKFPGKARLHLEAASRVTERKGTFRADTLLNWRDLEIDPLVCDVLPTSLPTRLIHHARFDDGSFYETHFGEDVVRLPVKMRFLARPPETRRSRSKSE